ncbi:MAG TPA: hypothetical protein VG738_19665 [Chitinophagaceae bacterium]|nr:hypothetical protein [Chitinophagaceae bacterium]
MKRTVIVFVICVGLLPCQSGAQIPAVAVLKILAKKVLVAIDLEVQRLQTQTVGLQNVQKVIENTMSSLKLTDIANWVQKQKDLYANYYQELWKIKSVIAYYERVKQIITEQVDLVNAYKQGFALLKQDKHFTADELNYMFNVYSGILDQSVRNLDQIYLVINAFTTQMSDAERLKIIDAAANRIDQNYSDVKEFTNQNIRLSLQRSKDETDLNTVKQLYGLP